MTQTLSGKLVLPDGTIQAGTLHFSANIEQITAQGSSDDVYILPGFIDTHVHGGGGGDTMDGPDGIRTMARMHAGHGTTTLLPTTMTNPWENVLYALNAVREVMNGGGVEGGADIVGAHLEGPFISPKRLGAQPPNTVDPTPERVQELLDLGVIRALTIAPEQPEAFAAGETFAKAGVRVGVGHTVADADMVTDFLKTVHAAGGRSSATHLYNAMGGVQGREPGPPAALMSDPHTYLEVILDFVHVHPTSFLLACAAAPNRTMLITDAMRAAGLGDGISELGGQKVIVKNGEAHLESGSLAGSVLTMDVALRNAVAAGLPLARASQMSSAVPAQSLGLTDRGELRAGLRADFVVLSPELNVLDVYVAGRKVSG